MKSISLRSIIREEVKNLIKEESSPSVGYENILKQLEILVLSGDIGNDDINNIYQVLKTARRKYTDSKRPPDSWRIAAQKGAQTRKEWNRKAAQRAIEYWTEVNDERRKELQGLKDRRDKGLLPIQISAAFGDHPSKKYYLDTPDPTEYSVWTIYRLKSQYLNSTDIPQEDLDYHNRLVLDGREKGIESLEKEIEKKKKYLDKK